MSFLTSRGLRSIYQGDLTIEKVVKETIECANNWIDHYPKGSLEKISLLPSLLDEKEEYQKSFLKYVKYVNKDMPLNPVFVTEFVGSLYACSKEGNLNILDFSLEEQYLLSLTLMDVPLESLKEKVDIIGNKQLTTTVLNKTKDVDISSFILDKVMNSYNKEEDISLFRQSKIEEIKNTPLPDILKQLNYKEELESERQRIFG